MKRASRSPIAEIEIIKAVTSLGLGGLIGAAIVAALMLFFPNVINNHLSAVENVLLGAVLGLACHKTVDKVVEELTPGRLDEVLKAVERVDIEPKAMGLLEPEVKRQLADEIIATAVKLPKKVAPRRRRAERTSRKSEG
jgi:hypothetical protein